MAKNMAKAQKLVEKTMTFEEIMLANPDAAGILLKKGMHCFGCSMAANETLEQGAIVHGLNPDKIVSEINKRIDKVKNKKAGKRK